MCTGWLWPYRSTPRSQELQNQSVTIRYRFLSYPGNIISIGRGYNQPILSPFDRACERGGGNKKQNEGANKKMNEKRKKRIR